MMHPAVTSFAIAGRAARLVIEPDKLSAAVGLLFADDAGLACDLTDLAACRLRALILSNPLGEAAIAYRQPREADADH
jgi:hypothetical protein